MKPRQNDLLVKLLLFVTRFTLALGLTRVFLNTNGLRTGFFEPFFPILLTMLVLALLFTPPRRALITILSLLLVAILALLLTPELVMPIREWLIEFGFKIFDAVMFFSGQSAVTESLIAFLIPLTAVIFTIIVHAFSVLIYAPLISAIIMLALMTITAFMGIRQDLLGAGLASAAILVLLVRRLPQQPTRVFNKPRPRHTLAALLAAIPIIIASLVISLVVSPLLPSRFGHQQQLMEGIIDDLTQLAGLPPAQELQPDFTLASAGYYPLETRLGGPVTLGSGPVMEVSGHNRTMLLRAGIFESYDGFTWRREPRAETFRFDNVFQNELRDKVFDLDQPDPELVSSGVVNNILEENRLEIKPLSPATSMIFTPGRPLEISPQTTDRFQVHFDDYGMLYSKYPLSTANPYVIISRVPVTGSELFQTSIELALELASTANEPRETLFPANYMAVPGLETYQDGGDLRQLVQKITAGIENPYEKALAIRSYLIDNAAYNLDVPVPPADEEFVTWFLKTGEGYCVYFATAQVMLSRLAGLPARYVEGFILNQPDTPNGMTTVTSDLAHAWAEIYLPYIGWVPVDATPGGTIPDETDPGEDPTAEPTLVPGETTAPTEAEATPTPVPEVDTPEAAVARRWRDFLFITLPLILAGILIRLEVRRRYKLLRYPKLLRAVFPDPRLRADIYWQELQLILAGSKLQLENGETPLTFLARAAADFDQSGKETEPAPRFEQIGRLIARIRYDKYEPNENELKFLATQVIYLDDKARDSNPVRHFLRYTLSPRLHAVDGKPRLLRGHFLKPMLK